MIRPLLAILLLAVPVFARQGTLTTQAGKTYTGEIILSPIGGLLITGTDGSTANVPLGDITTAQLVPSTNAPNFKSLVILRSGSALPAEIVSADESSLRLISRGNKLKTSTIQVAAILFRPVDPDQLPALQTGRTGVVLKNGDFIDGELRAIADKKLQLSTILFGIRKFEINQDVAAVVLHAITSSAAQFEIHTGDGGIYRAKAVPTHAAEDTFRFTDPTLGEQRVRFFDIIEIQKIQ